MLRVATLNVGTLNGRAAEVGKVFEKRKVDVGCVQETRWKGGSCKWFREKERGYTCRLFCNGCKEGRDGVGVFVAERWVESIVKIDRIDEGIIVIKMALGKRLLNIFLEYAPQAEIGRAHV